MQRAQRIDSIAQQGLNDQRDDPERRIFPAAIGVVEKETGAAMHGEDSAEQNWRQQYRREAGPDSEDQRNPAKEFGAHDDIGQSRRQTNLAEKRRRSGRG